VGGTWITIAAAPLAVTALRPPDGRPVLGAAGRERPPSGVGCGRAGPAALGAGDPRRCDLADAGAVIEADADAEGAADAGIETDGEADADTEADADMEADGELVADGELDGSGDSVVVGEAETLGVADSLADVGSRGGAAAVTAVAPPVATVTRKLMATSTPTRTSVRATMAILLRAVLPARVPSSWSRWRRIVFPHVCGLSDLRPRRRGRPACHTAPPMPQSPTPDRWWPRHRGAGPLP
jgi:hypothetical protein